MWNTVYMNCGIYVLLNMGGFVGRLERLRGQVPDGEMMPTRVAGDAARRDLRSTRDPDSCAIGLRCTMRHTTERPMREARGMDVLFSGQETNGRDQAQRAAPGRFAIASRAAASSAKGEEPAVPDVVCSSTAPAQGGSAGLIR